jgi:chromosome transmission fidelity protein 18
MFMRAGARRPPCIVLDELDGAAHGAEGHSAVAALVKLVTGAALLAAGAVITCGMALQLHAALAGLSWQKNQHGGVAPVCGAPPFVLGDGLEDVLCVTVLDTTPALHAGDGSSKRSKRRAFSGKAAAAARSGGGLGVPIICTANDAYAPCLRPLRDIAGVYHVKPPGPEKLMGRLAGIAAAEGLALDRQVRPALPPTVLYRMICHTQVYGCVSTASPTW